MKHKHFVKFSQLIGLLLFSNLHSQSLPPATDIYVVDLSVFDGVYYLGEPENITNRKGAYDNQPSFTLDSRSILYTATYGSGDDNQTEIRRHYLSSGRTTRITRTAESEYSPRPIPDDRALSVIRVEEDATQRLWRFTMGGMDPELVLQNIAPVGYHAWGNSEKVLLFVLGNPATLQTANILTGNSEILAENIGRSLKKIPNRDSWSFVQKSDQGGGWISELTIEGGQIEPLIAILDEEGFHDWTAEGVLLSSSGTAIFQWNPELQENWRRVADFNYLEGPISRISVSPDGTKIAIVVAIESSN